MKILTIINPSAGQTKAQKSIKTLPGLYRRYNLESTICISQSAEHVQQLAAQAVQDTYDIVAVCGGDGTLHHAINGLQGSQTALGILPMGSGNDLAGALGIPTNLDAACQILKQGHHRGLDLADTGRRVYACIAGVGLDSEVGKRTRHRPAWIRGKLIYPYAVLRSIFTFRPKFLRLVHDGGVFEGEILIAVVGNTRQYGGGMRIVPQADPEDGFLDVCIVRPMSQWYLLKAFPSVFTGKHVLDPHVIVLRTQSVRLETHEPLEVFGDGEFLEQTPSQINVRRNALQVIAPGR